METNPAAGVTPADTSGIPLRATTRLDSYVDRYAARTAGMTASEIRALFSVASRPEVVSLAGGMPNISGLPLDVVGGAISELIATQGPVAMQYGSGQGVPELREQICDVMRLEGIDAHPDDVVVTVGSQQAVDLVTRIFCDPGDVVICEAPSYVGALGVFKAYQCGVVHAEMDAEGLVPEALRQAITVTKATGRTIKFLYTIPNFHNPAGVTLTASRRREILEICRAEDILVLEDNPYGLLGFEGEPMRALRADEAEGVIYLGSFSKTFAPGFRVGWALAPHAVREKLVLAQESATLCPPQFSQMAVSAYLGNHDWQGQIKQFREMYRERRDAMVSALDDLMPASCRWNVPDGGFYVWLTLPPGIDAKAMLPRAVTARVAYVPGTAFFADGFGSSSMRLSFCYPTPERIREGVRRLAGVLETEMELRATFGADAPARGREVRSGYDAPSSDLT
jgi:2-aminoadipate transaminase